MADQNSVVEYQIRPDDLMEELGIKKDAYYAYVKHLDIKVGKADGKAFLSQEQANLLRSLRSHVLETGKMDGFANSNGELAVRESSSLEAATLSDEEPTIENDLGKQIFRAAAELKASELAMMPAIVREVANRMTKDDLPEDLKQKIEQTEEATRPNFHPGAIADNLIQQFRQSREQLA